MNSNLVSHYPPFPFNGGAKWPRFVFFSTLFHKYEPGPSIGAAAANYFHTTKIDQNTIDAQDFNIEAVLHFLSTVITSERRKETAFLNFLKSRSNLKLSIPLLDSDWSDFVRDIQNQMTAGNLGIMQLENERKRIKANYKQNAINRERALQEANFDFQAAQRGYKRSSYYKTAEQLKKVIDFLNGNDKSITGKYVINYIIKNYGDKLLTVDESNKLILNPQQLGSLIIGISQILLQHFNTIIQNLSEQDETKKKRRYDIRNLEQILSQDSIINNEINALLTDINNLPLVAKKLTKSYEIQTSNRQNKQYQNLIQQVQAQSMGNDAASSIISTTKEIQKYYSSHQINSNISNAITVVQTKNITSEVQDVLNTILNGATYSSRVGGKGGKTDTLIGYLGINPTMILTANELNGYTKLITQYEQTLENLENTMSSTNTTEYYRQQEENWGKTIQKIDKILEQLKRDYSILGNCFIIEDSAKYYETMYVERGTLKNRKMYTSFSGGSIGATITDQIIKINALAETGGISVRDTNWLINACINAGPGMIGANNKNFLEDYFSAIAAILLFDNQLGIVKEAFQPQESSTSTKQIHLFSLEGGYYPLSYILQLTYTHLQKVYNEAINIVNHGASTTLSGFVSHPSKFIPGVREMTPKDWENLGKESEKTVQLKVTFLAGFLDILDSLLSPPKT